MDLHSPNSAIVGIVALIRYARAAMTRDMELIRKIILEIQSRKDASHSPLQLATYDPAIVARHLELMKAAGLIEAEVLDGGEMPFVVVKDLTWAGHDFAAALANDNVWEKIRKTFSASDLATMPLSILKDVGVGLLSQWAKSQLGLS